MQNTVRPVIDHISAPSSPVAMSTTAGTIAFGTTFLALAAGLAVFAAVRQRTESPQMPVPTADLYPTISPEAAMPFIVDDHTFTRTPPSEAKVAAITTFFRPSSTPTPPTTTVAIIAAKQTAIFNTTYNRSLFPIRTPNNNRPRPRIRRTTTTMAYRPYNELDTEQGSYFEADQYQQASTRSEDALYSNMNNEFEPTGPSGDVDSFRQLYGYNPPSRRTSMTTPRVSGAFGVKQRTLSQGRRYYIASPTAAAAPWPPAGRTPLTISTPTTPTTMMPVAFVEPIIMPRMTRQQHLDESLFSSVLNDPIRPPPPAAAAVRPSNSVRRRATTPTRSIPRTVTVKSRRVSALPIPQVFADEPPSRRPADATSSTPILLTLFTAPENNNNNNNETKKSPSIISSSSTPKSHRRSILPSTAATSSATSSHHIGTSFVSSTPATSLIAAIGLLVFITVLLVVALFIQRRRFMARLRQISIGHCSVLPLPIAVPANSSQSVAAIMEMQTGTTSPSSNASSSSSSSSSPPLNGKRATTFSTFKCHKNKVGVASSNNSNSCGFYCGSSPVNPSSLDDDDDGKDVVKAMTSISNELIDSNGAVRYSTNSNHTYPMPLHHY